MIDISGSSVCYKCNDRYVGCHGKCNRYLQEVAVNNEEKKNCERRRLLITIFQYML